MEKALWQRGDGSETRCILTAEMGQTVWKRRGQFREPFRMEEREETIRHQTDFSRDGRGYAKVKRTVYTMTDWIALIMRARRARTILGMGATTDTCITAATLGTFLVQTCRAGTHGIAFLMHTFFAGTRRIAQLMDAFLTAARGIALRMKTFHAETGGMSLLVFAFVAFTGGKSVRVFAFRALTSGVPFAVRAGLAGASGGVVGDTGRTTEHWGLGAALWRVVRDFNFISGRHGGKKKRGSVPVFFFLSCLVGFMWCACVFVVFVVFYCFVGLWHERRDYFSSISKSS